MATQNGVHIARQLCSLAPPCSRRHVRHFFSHDCDFSPLHLTHPCRTNFRNEVVDISRESQLASIENSFAAAHSAEQLSSLRHPTKPRLRAVSTYEVLPDADVWANAYDLFRFSERPGERGPEVRFAVSLT
jgi:hypothetical protein